MEIQTSPSIRIPLSRKQPPSTSDGVPRFPQGSWTVIGPLPLSKPSLIVNSMTLPLESVLVTWA